MLLVNCFRPVAIQSNYSKFYFLIGSHGWRSCNHKL